MMLCQYEPHIFLPFPIFLRRLSGLSQNLRVPSCFTVGLEEMLAPTPTPVACFPQHLGHRFGEKIHGAFQPDFIDKKSTKRVTH